MVIVRDGERSRGLGGPRKFPNDDKYSLNLGGRLDNFFFLKKKKILVVPYINSILNGDFCILP